MKKKLLYLFVIGFAFFSTLGSTKAESKITLYLFRGEGCPHCEAALEYLDSIKKDYPYLEIVDYEVFEHEENVALWNQVKEKLESDSKGVPFIVIGERYLTGFAEYRKEDIRAALKYYQDHPNEYKDVVALVKTGSDSATPAPTTNTENIKPVEMHTSRDQMYQKLFITTGILIFLGGVYYYLYQKEKRA